MTAAGGVIVTSSLLVVPLVQIRVGVNARGDVGDVTELAMSIQQLGQLQPLLVDEREPGVYTVFDGHRRLAALRTIKADRATVVLRAPVDGPDRIIAQLAIATNSKTFDPMAESDAVYELYWTHNLGEVAIARQLGHSVKWVRDRLSLHQATPAERRDLAAGRVSIAHVLMAVSGRRVLRERGADPISPAATQPTPQTQAEASASLASESPGIAAETHTAETGHRTTIEQWSAGVAWYCNVSGCPKEGV